MGTRRSFIKKAALTGMAGILADGRAPAFAQEMKMLKIGQLGLGSHSFISRFNNPPDEYKSKVRCRPYAVWDDIPEAAGALMKNSGFQKIMKDPVELVKESDVVHVEHADTRRVFELAQPALEAGKPTFINRPFTSTIADAEEAVRLARTHDAPLMCASSLEFGDDVADMQAFRKEKGPIRAYEAYCCEPHFTWHFPHVINYAHAALGGGIESAYFTGDFVMDLHSWTMENKVLGASLCVLTYKPRNGEPPIIGMNHIGMHPGGYHIDVYTVKENKDFPLKGNWSLNMFMKQNEFFSQRKVPRPYEAILEQHRALVAANVSRLTGRAVKLDSLGGHDALPYSDSIRRWLLRLNKIIK
ncbi:Gfo/Idh/MocA family oxidoreductase [Candidatus Latescibacterota bacterium]